MNISKINLEFKIKKIFGPLCNFHQETTHCITWRAKHESIPCFGCALCFLLLTPSSWATRLLSPPPPPPSLIFSSSLRQLQIVWLSLSLPPSSAVAPIASTSSAAVAPRCRRSLPFPSQRCHDRPAGLPPLPAPSLSLPSSPSRAAPPPLLPPPLRRHLDALSTPPRGCSRSPRIASREFGIGAWTRLTLYRSKLWTFSRNWCRQLDKGASWGCARQRGWKWRCPRGRPVEW